MFYVCRYNISALYYLFVNWKLSTFTERSNIIIAPSIYCSTGNVSYIYSLLSFVVLVHTNKIYCVCYPTF